MFKTAGGDGSDYRPNEQVRPSQSTSAKHEDIAQRGLQHDHQYGSSFYQASGHNSQVYDPQDRARIGSPRD
jgi:murein tripeptide amidase MpaA